MFLFMIKYFKYIYGALMIKRISAAILCLILIITAFSGCLGNKKTGASFSMPITDEPTSLDPQIADSNSEKMIVLNCFEGLVRINSHGEIENGVAEEYYVSNDGLTYTFKLRDNAHWALFSGHKSVIGENYKDTFDINVYAEDFEFAFQRVFDEHISSPYTEFFSCIDSFSAPDRHTFIINLKYAYDGFLRLLTLPGAMPCDKEFYELTGGKYGLDAKYMLCNGAFNVSKWTEGTSIRIVKNDDYNGVNTINPASVTFYINSSDDTVFEKMLAKTYDAAFINHDNYKKLETTNADDYDSTEILDTVYTFVFNQANKYLENKNIRLAITHCLNLENISESAGGSKPAKGIVPEFCKIGDTLYRDINQGYSTEYNEALARELFEQGLLEIGASSVEVEIKCTEEYENSLKQVIQTLQKILGVKFVVSVNVMSASELTAAVSDGNYSVVFYPFTASSDSADDFLVSLSRRNLFGYNSEDFNAAIEQIKASKGNNAELINSCIAAENVLYNDAVVIPVLFGNSYFITNKKTEGIYFYSSPSNVVFMQALKK